MASDELAKKLNRRNIINEAGEDGSDAPRIMPSMKVFNPYTEFPEFSRSQIKGYEKMFETYDTGRDKYIDLQELKVFMEKLGCPQTHLGLKAMIHEVDEDNDNKISFREFLLIFRKAQAGEFEEGSGLQQLAALSEVDVDEVGVGEASKFFQSKINQQGQSSKFEAEIRAEQEEKRRAAEEKKQRRAEFQAKAAKFT
ncbi:EF-hand domain-containing protein D2 homolog [Watersipora subatra]|uniref:EF-hand domain-containing protein D2 homolog n=1 Tax=Watersipora subatra TaxID=2589382 RepID=UPI00355C8024